MQSENICFKILRSDKTHNNLQYQKGLNQITHFEENGSCVPGGIYFCDPRNPKENICRYLHFGDILVDVKLPLDDTEFKMVQDPSGNKSRANKIIIGEEYNLSDPSTFEYMARHGTDVKKNYVLAWACDKNFWNVVSYLIEITPMTESRVNIIIKKLLSILTSSKNISNLLDTSNFLQNDLDSKIIFCREIISQIINV
ncbi:ankyrin repeat protein [Megavirus baoshan]|uniref:Ankyrin repeat protein n=1 Tax=Megavirus baoshan TaxID=2496520 RepID=A0A3S8UYC9_9VIRU|nr:ankyrin repeat protein [Megavirus baoshan]AZL89825.1 ankyrin repeat protein [Megavirus baoshan]